MRLFILLALFIMPLTAVQLYSTDSHALTSNSAHPEFINKMAGPAKQPAVTQTFLDDGLSSKATAMKNQQDKHVVVRKKPKTAKVFRGKTSSKGMQLLSVLLLLKDKQK